MGRKQLCLHQMMQAHNKLGLDLDSASIPLLHPSMFLSQPHKITLTYLGLVKHTIDARPLTVFGSQRTVSHPAFMSLAFSHPPSGVDFKRKCPQALTLSENQLLEQRRKNKKRQQCVLTSSGFHGISFLFFIFDI